LALSSIAFFGRYILFADGSYMAGAISQNKNFFINTVEWNRSLSYVLTQFLPVAISNNPNPTLNQIVDAYGFACIFPACLLLVSALVKLESIGKGRFFYVALPLFYGVGLLICVSTSLVGAAALFWIFVNLHTKDNLNSFSNISIFSIFAFSSLFGDSYILFAPSFIFLLIFQSKQILLKKLLVGYLGILAGVSVNI
jgi:hypothetical protein